MSSYGWESYWSSYVGDEDFFIPEHISLLIDKDVEYEEINKKTYMGKINVKLYDPNDIDCQNVLSSVDFIDEQPAEQFINFYRDLSYYITVHREN